MNDSVEIIEKLFTYYKVTNVSQLSKKMNTSQATISNWKVRNSINAIKKRCRELDIYEEIFNEHLKSNNEDVIEEEVDKIYHLILDHTKYQLKDKLQNYTDSSFVDWLNKLVPKKYLISILDDFAKNKEKYTIINSKDFLIERVKGLEVSKINNTNKLKLSSFIEKRLSKIECYVLIHNHEEIMDYKGYFSI